MSDKKVRVTLVKSLNGRLDNHLFKTNVAPDDISRMVEQEKRQKTAHATVPVVEWMYGNEIEDEKGGDE